MSDGNNSSSNSGVGVGGLLGVAFVVLKLTHVIDWSWWWVTAPFWGGAIAFVLVASTVAVWLVYDEKRIRREVKERQEARRQAHIDAQQRAVKS